MSDVNGDVPIRQCPKCSGPVILKDVLAAPESSSSRVTVFQEQVCLICSWQPTRRPPDSGIPIYYKPKGNNHHPTREQRVLELDLTIYSHDERFSATPHHIVTLHRITAHLLRPGPSHQRLGRKRHLWRFVQVEKCPCLLYRKVEDRHSLKVAILTQLFNAFAAHGISPQDVMGIQARFPGNKPYWTEVYDEWLQMRGGKSSG